MLATTGNRHSSLEQHLNEWGFEWDHTDSIEAAFTKLESAAKSGKPYDVALIDQSGLGNTGVIQSLALRFSSNPSLTDTNLILISPHDLAQASQRALLTSGYFCILKSPVEKRFLFNALHATSMVHSKASNVTRLINFKSDSDVTEKLDILVGEDNATNQKVIRAILEYAGHNVDIFDNGTEVLDAIEDKNYDLTILDMHMPEIDGIEAAKTLRFLQTGKDRRPIIMLTADATVDAIKACEDADIDVYLTKPIESEKLLATIEKLSPKNRKTRKQDAPVNLQTLNLESLDKLSSLSSSTDFMNDLVSGFLTDTKQLITKIEFAVEKNNYNTIQDHAHAIKGSALNIGATSLADCASRLVSHCQKEDTQSISDLCNELFLEFELTNSALNSYLKKLDSAVL